MEQFLIQIAVLLKFSAPPFQNPAYATEESPQGPSLVGAPFFDRAIIKSSLLLKNA